jgi:hypothetical protein
MVRDFDQERKERLAAAAANIDPEELQFKLGGEVFHRLPEPPATALAVLSRLDGTAGDAQNMKVVLDALMGFLPEGEGDRFMTMLGEHPEVTLVDVQNVIETCLVVATGRPQVPSSPSTDGDGGTGTRLTAGSPSPAVPLSGSFE